MSEPRHRSRTRSRSRLLLAPCGLALAAVLSACDADVSGGSSVRQGIDNLSRVLAASPLNLPAIPIDVSPDGRIARVAGFEAEVVDRYWERVAGTPLIGRVRYFANDEGGRSYVDWFVDSNIQHITVATREEGLYVVVNGEPLPHLEWDEESLRNLVALVHALTEEGGAAGEGEDEGAGEGDDGTAARALRLLSTDQANAVADLLPLMRSLNVRLDFRFPLKQRARGEGMIEEIPMAGSDVFNARLTRAERDAEPEQTVDIDIAYRPLEDDAGWVPTLFGFSTVDLKTLLRPMDVDVPMLRLREDLRARIELAGIESLSVEIGARGVFFATDDRPLPRIRWNERSLGTVSAVLADLYPPGTELPEGALWVPTVQTTAPMYNDFDLKLTVRFPTAD